MKNSEQLLTLTDYIQQLHVLIDQFAVEWRTMHDNDPERYSDQMSKEYWNDELFYSLNEW